MSNGPVRLTIIIGSTREGRLESDRRELVCGIGGKP